MTEREMLILKSAARMQKSASALHKVMPWALGGLGLAGGAMALKSPAVQSAGRAVAWPFGKLREAGQQHMLGSGKEQYDEVDIAKHLAPLKPGEAPSKTRDLINQRLREMAKKRAREGRSTTLVAPDKTRLGEKGADDPELAKRVRVRYGAPGTSGTKIVTESGDEKSSSPLSRAAAPAAGAAVVAGGAAVGGTYLAARRRAKEMEQARRAAALRALSQKNNLMGRLSRLPGWAKAGGGIAALLAANKLFGKSEK